MTTNRLDLLVQNSTLTDGHRLRDLAPEIDTAVRLRYARGPKKWWADDEPMPWDAEQATVAALAAYIECVAAIDVKLLLAMTQRLLASTDEYHLARAWQCAAILFCQFDYEHQFADLLRDEQEAVDLKSLDSCEMLKRFERQAQRKAWSSSDAPPLAVRLLHFAVERKAYGCARTLLTHGRAVEIMPLTIWPYVEKSVTNELMTIVGSQQENPDGALLYLSSETADQLATSIAGLSKISEPLELLAKYFERQRLARKFGVIRGNWSQVAQERRDELRARERQLKSQTLLATAEQRVSNTRQLMDAYNQALSSAKSRLRKLIGTGEEQPGEQNDDDDDDDDDRDDKLDVDKRYRDFIADCAEKEKRYAQRWEKLANEDLPQADRSDKLEALDVHEKLVSAMYNYYAWLQRESRHAAGALERAHKRDQTDRAIAEKKSMEELKKEISELDADDFFGTDD